METWINFLTEAELEAELAEQDADWDRQWALELESYREAAGTYDGLDRLPRPWASR